MASNLLQTIRNVGRLTHIVNVFARHGFRKEIQRTELGEFVSLGADSEGASVREEMAWSQRLVLALEELGPTFVKLGQLLASREDLLPRHVLVELKRLQDRARPFSPELLDRVLSAEFGAKREDLFASISPVPLGAASIGQVHQAVLRDGREVVIKVQRPDIENVIRTDLSILAGIAKVLESAFEELRRVRLAVMVEELSRSLQAELDYLREAANTERAKKYFEAHESIYVPEVYRDFCTRRVLCLEFIKGRKLTRREPDTDYKDVVRSGVRAFMDMTFKLGVFHADLHPGNFMLMDDGRLAILDFGLTARLSRDIRETFALMFVALVHEDLDAFSRLYLDITVMEGECDRQQLEAEIRDTIDAAFSVRLSELQLGKLLLQVARISAAHRVTVSRDLVLFFRALVALETFARTLDPEFDILVEASNYAETLPVRGMTRAWLEHESLYILRDLQVLLRELPLTLKLLTRRAQTGQLAFRFESGDIEGLARELERASNRLTVALVMAALALSGSIMTFGGHKSDGSMLFTVGAVAIGAGMVLGVILLASAMRRPRRER
jgi:ubiquinone biosynthesis protein